MTIKQHKPLHPGEFIDRVYMKPFRLKRNDVAKRLKVSPSTLTRLLNSKSVVSSEMAIRLSAVLGRSPESWMMMQDNYDLCEASQRVDIEELHPINFAAA